MRILTAAVAPNPARGDFERLHKLFLDRLANYAAAEDVTFRSEAALLLQVEKQKTRTRPLLVLLDSRGKAMASDELARWIGGHRDAGLQQMIFAIGPADGWSKAALARADFTLSFGPMTLPHELARLVLVEQLYRAFTILAGHPYHSGH